MSQNQLQDNIYKSTCSYCGVGCGVLIEKEKNGKLHLKGDPDHPANQGKLCSKGMNLHYAVMDQSDRLMYPRMRWNKYQDKKRVSWDTAISRVASVFNTLTRKFGSDAVGLYVSGQLLTEAYYVANKLTKGFLGTNNIDTNSRLCMSSAVTAYKKSLGEDSVPVSYEDIDMADCFFIAGANPAWCHPVLFRRIEARKEENPDTRIIVVDPRKTQSCMQADLHLQIQPGTDITLYNAIARYLIEQNYVDQDFIIDHTNGYQELCDAIKEKTIGEAALECDVAKEDIIKAAEYIGNAKGFISMWAMGLNQSSVGVNKNLSLINLHLITGKIGKAGSGPFSLTGQPNAMGGREVGGLSTMLAAHRELNNADHRREVADFWSVSSVPEKPGYTATEMFENLASGNMKAIWIICTNPLVSLPDARLVEEALKKARFVVVQDISANSATLPYADVVLPAAGYMEKEGTMTNSDRRVSYLNKVIDPPGEALPDTEIISRVARKMGFEKAFNYKSPAEIYDEHARLTAGTSIDVSGLNYKLLKEKGTVQWPFPPGSKGGTPRLFTDHKFHTTNGKARIHGMPGQNLSEPLSPDYPLVLTTGRIRDQWHTMTRTGKVQKLNQHINRPFLEIHPEDASERGIKDGDAVKIHNPRGDVQVTAQYSGDIKKGVVFLPMHWGKIFNKDFARANNLTNNLIDPYSKQPDFKFSAVQVEKVAIPPRKIIIVGAGAGAYKFVTEYRKKNTQDEISVFSKEKYPFYDRVMLPEYVNNKKSWSLLEKTSPGEIEGMDIQLEKGNWIEKINASEKTVTDASGKVHEYDKLVLATGSRATRPPGYPQHLGHVLTIRSRNDAEFLKENMDHIQEVVIVGGGLLGLEMADSLHSLGKKVSIVQRSSRLMERVLDPEASEMLHDELSERGMTIYYNDEVRQAIGNEVIEGIRLKSRNKTITCQALIYAIGTRPNIELAKEGGLKCNRGVAVNEYMQTSDHDIYAIGEIAEFKQNLYGITAAAEEQAMVAIDHLMGNYLNYYEGSLSMNILKIEDFKLASAGLVNPSSDDYETVVYRDKSQRYYKKCVIKNDRMVGAVFVGDNTEFARFRDWIRQRIELGEQRKGLLIGESREHNVIGPLVCSCNNVGQGNIENAVKNGCHDLQQLCETTAAGTGCGSCKPEVKAILENQMEPAS